VACFESLQIAEGYLKSLGSSLILWEVLDTNEDFGVTEETCEASLRKMTIEEVYGE